MATMSELGVTITVEIPAAAKVHVYSVARNSDGFAKLDALILDGHPEPGKVYLLVEVDE